MGKNRKEQLKLKGKVSLQEVEEIKRSIEEAKT